MTLGAILNERSTYTHSLGMLYCMHKETNTKKRVCYNNMTQEEGVDVLKMNVEWVINV